MAPNFKSSKPDIIRIWQRHYTHTCNKRSVAQLSQSSELDDRVGVRFLYPERGTRFVYFPQFLIQEEIHNTLYYTYFIQ